jgi:23S rRNA G2069 N7-methylase RlmK/C1962 C5-methylase RlmI
MGWHSLLEATEGAAVTLMDYSQNALENAQKRFIE